MSVKVIDNFLNKNIFDDISSVILSQNFNWFWRDTMTYSPKEPPYVGHVFYVNNTVNSNHYEKIILPILNKLKAEAIVLARANLTFNNQKKYKSKWHTDFDDKNAKTAIFYLNDNQKTHLDSVLVLEYATLPHHVNYQHMTH